MSDQAIALKTSDSPTETDLQTAFPALLVRAGRAACFAADEFFSAQISPPRRAYARAVGAPLMRACRKPAQEVDATARPNAYPWTWWSSLAERRASSLLTEFTVSSFGMQSRSPPDSI